jgi:hypothetical protein
MAHAAAAARQGMLSQQQPQPAAVWALGTVACLPTSGRFWVHAFGQPSLQQCRQACCWACGATTVQHCWQFHGCAAYTLGSTLCCTHHLHVMVSVIVVEHAASCVRVFGVCNCELCWCMCLQREVQRAS